MALSFIRGGITHRFDSKTFNYTWHAAQKLNLNI